MKKVIRSQDWIIYADAVGDTYLIHRDDAFARSLGLEGIIAPGMFIASHSQTQERVSEAKFNFPALVYDQETLDLSNEKGFRAMKEKGAACLGRVKVGDEKEASPILIPTHTYETEITRENVERFLESIGMEMRRIPELFVMSLSAPALINYSANHPQPTTGARIHFGQSIKFHADYDYGLMQVDVCDRKLTDKSEYLKLQWRQGDKVIATGDSTIKLAA